MNSTTTTTQWHFKGPVIRYIKRRAEFDMKLLQMVAKTWNSDPRKDGGKEIKRMLASGAASERRSRWVLILVLGDSSEMRQACGAASLG